MESLATCMKLEFHFHPVFATKNRNLRNYQSRGITYMIRGHTLEFENCKKMSKCHLKMAKGKRKT